MTDTDWIEGWNLCFDQAWEQNSGPGQTAFFARVALAGLPMPLIELIRDRGLELLDWGCAMGDALGVFAQAFPASPLTGLDVSRVGIAKAAARFPQHHFTTEALSKQDRPYSVVYTSNCLEHFEDPIGILRREILPWVGDYLIVLVPYLEHERSPGHLVTFTAESFPPQLDGLAMLLWRALPTLHLPDSHWPGQQLLLVYARRQAAGIETLIPALREMQARIGSLA